MAGAIAARRSGFRRWTAGRAAGCPHAVRAPAEAGRALWLEGALAWFEEYVVLGARAPGRRRYASAGATIGSPSSAPLPSPVCGSPPARR
jgi:hypothetical protein